MNQTVFPVGIVTVAAMIGGFTVWSRDGKPVTQATPPKIAKQTSANSPVVLELFTSQGCSSCPPADALLSRLAKNPALLVISRPVTYWDRLGWKETLGRQENTALQRGYARKGNVGAGVYTPQIVVDGRHGAVGSNEAKVRELAKKAATYHSVGIRTTNKTDGSATAKVIGLVKGRTELMVLALSSRVTVKISSGENGGRTIAYTNVVRGETRIDPQPRDAATYAIPAKSLNHPQANRYAVILRRPDAGPIRAAKTIG